MVQIPHDAMKLQVFHYIWTVTFVLIAILVKLVLGVQAATEGTFLLLLVPVLLSAWYGGAVAGVLTTVVAALLADYLFLTPRANLTIGSGNHDLVLALFAGEALLATLLMSVLRRQHARNVAQVAEEQLARRSAEARLAQLQHLRHLKDESYAQRYDEIAHARSLAENALRRTLLLDEASRLLGQSSDYQQSLNHAAQAGVAALCASDQCVRCMKEQQCASHKPSSPDT
jgi:K+-sensing histidine kinase KdpD